MQARIAHWERSDMSDVDLLVAAVAREAGPDRPPGMAGFLLLLDRAGGRGSGISLWESAEAFHAAAPTIGRDVPEELKAGSRLVASELYELVRYEVDGPAQAATVLRAPADPGGAESSAPGRRGVLVLDDSGGAGWMQVTLWATKEDAAGAPGERFEVAAQLLG